MPSLLLQSSHTSHPSLQSFTSQDTLSANIGSHELRHHPRLRAHATRQLRRPHHQRTRSKAPKTGLQAHRPAHADSDALVGDGSDRHDGAARNRDGMRTQHIAAIRAACIKANPSNAIQRRKCDTCKRVMGSSGVHGKDCKGLPYIFMDTKHDLRLADVLSLLDGEINISLSGERGLFMAARAKEDGVIRPTAYWNLRTDDLEAQSDETIAFIHSLLAI